MCAVWDSKWEHGYSIVQFYDTSFERMSKSKNKCINLSHLQYMYACDTLHEMLKHMMDCEWAVKYVNHPSNVIFMLENLILKIYSPGTLASIIWYWWYS